MSMPSILFVSASFFVPVMYISVISAILHPGTQSLFLSYLPPVPLYWITAFIASRNFAISASLSALK